MVNFPVCSIYLKSNQGDRRLFIWPGTMVKSSINRLLRKAVSAALAVSHLTALSPPPVWADTALQARSERSQEIQPFDALHQEIPSKIGQVVEFRAPEDSKPALIILQDAHAHPEAQMNMARLIDWYVRRTGILQVYSEGASGPLDATVLRSFPDREALKNTVNAFLKRGEISGVTAAAILSPHAIRFLGAENRELYAQGIGYFLLSLEHEGAIKQNIQSVRDAVHALKRNQFSRRLLEIDALAASIETPEENLLTNFLKLAEILPPKTGTPAAQMLARMKLITKNQGLLTGEISAFESGLEKHLAESGSNRDLQRDFVGARQLFRTSQMDTVPYAWELMRLAKKSEWNHSASQALRDIAAVERDWQNAAGSDLMKDLKRYTGEVKNHFYRHPVEKRTDELSHILNRLEKLAGMEIDREDWETLKSIDRSKQEAVCKTIRRMMRSDLCGDQPWILNPESLFASHYAFYRNAEARENAFVEKIKTGVRSAKRDHSAGETSAFIFAAGGFHSQGLIEKIKTMGWGYVLVSPVLSDAGSNQEYREMMFGRIPWMKDETVPDHKSRAYDYFLRAFRSELLSEKSPARKSSDTPFFWRENLLRVLARENRLPHAGEYTGFLDELIRGREGVRDRDRWKINVDRFLANLEQLENRNRISVKGVMKLLSQSTINIPELGTALSPGDWFPSRSELIRRAKQELQILSGKKRFAAARRNSRSEVRAPDPASSDDLFSWLQAVGKEKLHQSLEPKRGKMVPYWLREEFYPRYEDLVAIADALQVDPVELMNLRYKSDVQSAGGFPAPLADYFHGSDVNLPPPMKAAIVSALKVFEASVLKRGEDETFLAGRKIHDYQQDLSSMGKKVHVYHGDLFRESAALLSPEDFRLTKGSPFNVSAVVNLGNPSDYVLFIYMIGKGRAGDRIMMVGRDIKKGKIRSAIYEVPKSRFFSLESKGHVSKWLRDFAWRTREDYFLKPENRDSFVRDFFSRYPEPSPFKAQILEIRNSQLVFPVLFRDVMWRPILGHMSLLGLRRRDFPRVILHTVRDPSGKVKPFVTPDGRMDYLFILPAKNETQIYDSLQVDPSRHEESYKLAQQPLVKLANEKTKYHVSEDAALQTFFMRLLSRYGTWRLEPVAPNVRPITGQPRVELPLGVGESGRLATFYLGTEFYGAAAYLTPRGHTALSKGVPVVRLFAVRKGMQPSVDSEGNWRDQQGRIVARGPIYILPDGNWVDQDYVRTQGTEGKVLTALSTGFFPVSGISLLDDKNFHFSNIWKRNSVPIISGTISGGGKDAVIHLPWLVDVLTSREYGPQLGVFLGRLRTAIAAALPMRAFGEYEVRNPYTRAVFYVTPESSPAWFFNVLRYSWEQRPVTLIEQRYRTKDDDGPPLRILRNDSTQLGDSGPRSEVRTEELKGISAHELSMKEVKEFAAPDFVDRILKAAVRPEIKNQHSSFLLDVINRGMARGYIGYGLHANLIEAGDDARTHFFRGHLKVLDVSKLSVGTGYAIAIKPPYLFEDAMTPLDVPGRKKMEQAVYQDLHAIFRYLKSGGVSDSAKISLQEFASFPFLFPYLFRMQPYRSSGDIAEASLADWLKLPADVDFDREPDFHLFEQVLKNRAAEGVNIHLGYIKNNPKFRINFGDPRQEELAEILLLNYGFLPGPPSEFAGPVWLAPDIRKKIKEDSKRFGISVVERRVVVRQDKQSRPWVMTSIRSEEFSPVITSLPEMPAVSLQYKPDLPELRLSSEGGNSRGTFLNVGKVQGEEHPVVVKLFVPKTSEGARREELIKAQALDRLGVGPRFYGVVRDENDNVTGYVMQIVSGVTENDADYYPSFSRPNLFATNPDLKEIRKRLVRVGLFPMTDYIKTPAGRYIAIGAGNIAYTFPDGGELFAAYGVSLNAGQDPPRSEVRHEDPEFPFYPEFRNPENERIDPLRGELSDWLERNGGISWDAGSGYGMAKARLSFKPGKAIHVVADPEWAAQFPELQNFDQNKPKTSHPIEGAFGQLAIAWSWNKTQVFFSIDEIQPGDGFRKLNPNLRRQLDGWRQAAILKIEQWAVEKNLILVASSPDIVRQIHRKISDYEIRKNYMEPFVLPGWETVRVPYLHLNLYQRLSHRNKLHTWQIQTRTFSTTQLKALRRSEVRRNEDKEKPETSFTPVRRHAFIRRLLFELKPDEKGIRSRRPERRILSRWVVSRIRKEGRVPFDRFIRKSFNSNFVPETDILTETGSAFFHREQERLASTLDSISGTTNRDLAIGLILGNREERDTSFLKRIGRALIRYAGPVRYVAVEGKSPRWFSRMLRKHGKSSVSLFSHKSLVHQAEQIPAIVNPNAGYGADSYLIPVSTNLDGVQDPRVKDYALLLQTVTVVHMADILSGHRGFQTTHQTLREELTKRLNLFAASFDAILTPDGRTGGYLISGIAVETFLRYEAGRSFSRSA